MDEKVIIAWVSWSGGISFTLIFLFLVLWFLLAGKNRTVALVLTAVFGCVTLALALENIARLFPGWT